jgi:hypothetical protein
VTILRAARRHAPTEYDDDEWTAGEPRPLDGPRGGRARRRMRRAVLAVLVVVTILLTATTAWVVRSAQDRSSDHAGDVRAELTTLRAALDAGAGEDMQAQFPEGFFFMHALNGLAWTDLAAGGHADRAVARAEAQRAVDRLASPAGTAPFTASLAPPFGVFHAGWSLLLQAQLAALDPPGSDLQRTVTTNADLLAQAFAANLDAGRSPFLEAYPSRSWPVDSVVAMAALRTADRVAGSDHGALVERWLARTEALMDPATGLLPHVTDPATGRALEGPRATSQSVIQRFWPVVDPAGAPHAYGRFRELFVTSVLGTVGVREYPPGVDGAGDVDSGPLVRGVSASATVVTIGAARANGDLGLATALTQQAQVLRLPPGTRGRYLLGRVPIAEAFLAWARAAPLGPPALQADLIVWWPLLMAVPWVPVLGLWWFVLRRRRRRGRVTTGSPG